MVSLSACLKRKNTECSALGVYGLAFAAAICATLAISSKVVPEGASSSEKLMTIFPVHSGQFLLAILLALLFGMVFRRVRLNVAALVVSGLFSACVVIGRSFNEAGNLSCLKDGLVNILASAVCWFGFACLAYAVICVCYWCLRRLSDNGSRPTAENEASMVAMRPFLFPLLVILVCWMPYVVALFPGMTCYDLVAQLQQFFGASNPTNHHPWFMTIVFGGLYQLGFTIGGCSNAGLFAIALMQVLASAATGANIQLWLSRLCCPKLIRCSTLAFFALWPIFPIYGMWCVKDVLSALLMTNFLMQVVLRVFASRSGVLSTRGFLSWPCIVTMAVFCSLSRNNCVYIVLPTLLVMVLFMGREERKTVVAAVLAVASAFAIWSYVFLPLASIEKGNVREALSLPLLQTAKVVGLHGAHLNVGEREAIQNACAVSIEDLGELYSHRTADNVKFKFTFEEGELREWAKAYIDLGIRYPGDYLYVLLETNYGYLYPAPSQGYAGLRSEIDPVSSVMINQQFIDHKDSDATSLEHVLYDLSPTFPGLRSCLSSLIEVANNLPFTWVVFAPAGYIWICVILLVYIAQHNKPGLLLVVPFVLLLLVCLISPLNGSIRYALPYVYLLPFVLGCATSALRVSRSSEPKHDLSGSGSTERRG